MSESRRDPRTSCPASEPPGFSRGEIQIFLYPISEATREYAVLFEEDGRWVAGEQHYPVPFINSQTKHRSVGGAVMAALKAAGWKGGKNA